MSVIPLSVMTATTIGRGATSGAAASREAMPGGIALSAGLHAMVAALVVLGLPNLFRQPPPQDMPIAVQLVAIAPETRATRPNPFRPQPDAKPEPPVAAPAPKPEPKPEPEPPAPAPPPAAAAPPVAAPPPPPPKPEAKAPPAPLPPPPPPAKPAEARTPALPPPPVPEPKPKPKPEPQVARAEAKPEPKPKPEPKQPEGKQPDVKKVAPTAFNKLLKELEEKKDEPETFDSILKNLTRQQVAQADDEPPPAPRRMAALSPPSSQPKAPLGSELTANEMAVVMEQLYQCWNVPAGARDARDLTIEIRVRVGPDGTARQATIVDQSRLGDPLFQAAAESAKRTFFHPKCTPLRLPLEKYETWKDLSVRFSPRDIL